MMEDLDQLDRPWAQRTKSRRSAQASAVPPMVHGITPQDSPAGMDKESKQRESPTLNQTVIEKRDERG